MHAKATILISSEKYNAVISDPRFPEPHPRALRGLRGQLLVTPLIFGILGNVFGTL